MSDVAPPVAALVEEFSKLPGIGVKTAQRLTFFILRSPTDQARRLADAIMRVKESIVYCSRCFNLTETDPCSICSNQAREQDVICVVEEPLDVLALEKTGRYKGLYHVLHGALSPMNGIGPKDIRIAELLRRLEDGKVSEVIMATNPGFEGDYTASTIRRDIQSELKLPELKITALARGLPLGSDLEYADEDTEGMLDECQLLDPDKAREPQDDIIVTHLETLLLLTTTREARDRLREIKLYPILRELDSHSDNQDVKVNTDRIVQVIMRGEEGEERDDEKKNEEVVTASDDLHRVRVGERSAPDAGRRG